MVLRLTTCYLSRCKDLLTIGLDLILKEWHISMSLYKTSDIIEAFNSTSRYLDDLLNIDNIYFDQMVDRIYPTELQLNRANSSDTEAPFFGFESMYI